MTANALVAAGHHGLASAVHKYIGSFYKARRLAGIPSPDRLEPDEITKWDEDTIISEILRRHAAGEPVAYRAVPTKLADAAVYYFETWKKAVEASGLDYSSIRRSSPAWTRDAIIATLRRAAGRRGRKPHVIPPAVWLAARRAFGSTRAAVEAAGLDVGAVKRRFPLSDRELARELRQLVRRSPNISLGAIRNSPLGRVAARRFGTLERGLDASRIDWKRLPTDARRVRRNGARSRRKKP